MNDLHRRAWNVRASCARWLSATWSCGKPASPLPDLADALRRLVSAWGHVPYVASNGRAAIELAERWPPDVVVMDLLMPIMDGYQAARMIRAEHPGARLIAITGDASGETRSKAGDAGFHHYLSKPLDLAALEILIDASSFDPLSPDLYLTG